LSLGKIKIKRKTLLDKNGFTNGFSSDEDKDDQDEDELNGDYNDLKVTKYSK
jgi:hypothetical protein